MGKFIDLTGQTFGKLTVIKRHPVNRISPNGTSFSRWVVRCECGKYKVVLGTSLKSGKTKSCGFCWRKAAHDQNLLKLVGHTFGHLTVIKRHPLDHIRPDGHHTSRMIVRCDCGQYLVVHTYNLKLGRSLSCGQGKCNPAYKHGMWGTPEYNRLVMNKRRELSKILDTAWTLEMERLLVQTQPNCVICDTPAEATDHVLPLSKGYGLMPGNAVRLCYRCNSSKKDKLLDDLDKDIALSLINAAEQFRCEWEHYQENGRSSSNFQPASYSLGV